MKTAIHAELPEQLVVDARAFVEQGWVGDFDELLAEALRRHLESHSTRLAESFIREGGLGVAWPGMSLRRNDRALAVGCDRIAEE